ncbi:MAG: hypothetical protein V9E89_14960 [Ilumatobacteraceae bacterium]
MLRRYVQIALAAAVAIPVAAGLLVPARAAVSSGPQGSTPGTAEPLPTMPSSGDVPLQVPRPLQASTGKLPPLIPLPAGCSAPPTAAAIFEGKLVANSSTTARFQVTRMRTGSLRGYAVGKLVDVLYVQETRFLRLGEEYVVGVGASKGRLISRVREPAPKFGGDAVIGVNDTDAPCPVLEDPIRTLLADGSPVESGVFSEMTSSSTWMLQALLGPLAAGLLILAGLAILKQVVFATGRSVRGVMDHEAEVMRIHPVRRSGPAR